MMRYTAEIWQDNVMVASVDASTAEDCEREAIHYATQYMMDGSVTVKFNSHKPIERIQGTIRAARGVGGDG
jgi:hypothetical protein